MDDQRLVNLAVQKGLVSRDQVARAELERRVLEDRGLQASVLDVLLESGQLNEADAWKIRKSLSNNSLKALEVDGYVIQGRIGAGGMGDVFRGVNDTGQVAAIKLLSPRFNTNEEYLRRFEREARAAMRLDHPHIAKSLAAGTVNGVRYMLMELVEGLSLKARIDQEGPLSEAEALTLMTQMASALSYSWDHGVLHRDVKPANIILGTPRPGVDEPFCAKLIDFGLAKVWQNGGAVEESRGGLTGAGLALGTPHYMSPEQASGQQDLDQRCDIYGLGASLYHALLGHTMFSGKNSEVIMFKQVSEQIDLNELRAMRVRGELVDLLREMLVKNRHRRIGSWPLVLAAASRLRELKPPPARTRSGPGDSEKSGQDTDPAHEVATLEGVVPFDPGLSGSRPSPVSASTRSTDPRTRPHAHHDRADSPLPFTYLVIALIAGFVIIAFGLWQLSHT